MLNFIENAWGIDARKNIRITWGEKRWRWRKHQHVRQEYLITSFYRVSLFCLINEYHSWLCKFSCSLAMLFFLGTPLQSDWWLYFFKFEFSLKKTKSLPLSNFVYLWLMHVGMICACKYLCLWLWEHTKCVPHFHLEHVPSSLSIDH